ncbi:MAG TPA: hypothetical protein DDW52_21970, partial [Planctomycetaceae bacterium]|nr:hypothetical protein [Planctomycetaceae bacterium]
TAVAILFVVFYFRELLSGGANLPIRSPNAYNGIVWILLYTKWDLVSLYFFHMFLLVVLLAYGMINYDRFRVPLRSGLIALAVTIALASSLPHLNPMVLSWKASLGAAPASLVVSVVGCLVGALAGAAFAPLAKRKIPTKPEATDSESSELQAMQHQPADSQSGSTIATDEPTNTVDQDNAPYKPPATDTSWPETPAADLEKTELYGASSREPSNKSDVVLSLALVGAALGSEAVLMVAVASLLTFGLERIIRSGLAKPGFWPATLHVFAVTTVLLACWSAAQRGLSLLIANTIGG